MLLKQQSEKLEEEYDQLNQQLESSKVKKKVLSWPPMRKLWIALSTEQITIHRY